MAELIDLRELHRPQHEGHAAVVAGHIATTGGVVSFLREASDGVQDQYFFVGGLVSGCAYDLPACETAQTGSGATMIRHANRRYTSDVLEIDAAEVAEAIELLAGDSRAHIIGHSKGTKVGLMAAAQLGSHIDVVSVTLVNPALGLGFNRGNILRKASELPGTALSLAAAMKPSRAQMNVQRGARKEIIQRSPAIIAEAIALIRTQGITRQDVEMVQGRSGSAHRPVVIMAYGTNDRFTRQNDIEEAIERENIQFDATLKLEKSGENDHLAFVNNVNVIRAILSVEDLIVRAMRESVATANTNLAA